MIGELEFCQARHIAGAVELCGDLENCRASGLRSRQTLLQHSIFRQFFEIMKGRDPRQFSLAQLIDQPRHRADACDLDVDAGGLVQHLAQQGLARGSIKVSCAAFRRHSGSKKQWNARQMGPRLGASTELVAHQVEPHLRDVAGLGHQRRRGLARIGRRAKTAHDQGSAI